MPGAWRDLLILMPIGGIRDAGRRCTSDWQRATRRLMPSIRHQLVRSSEPPEIKHQALPDRGGRPRLRDARTAGPAASAGDGLEDRRASAAVGRRGELRIAASSMASVVSCEIDAVVGEAEAAQGRPLVDVAEQLVDGADGRAGRARAASRRRTRRRARSRRGPARGRARRGRSAGPPGRTAASAVPWATRPRVPIAWPSAWTSPTPVPLAWPTPARCEAISIWRARLEVRSVGDGAAQPRADRPDDAQRHRLGERVRVGRQQRLERMGHRVDAGRGGDEPAAARRSGPDPGSSRPAAAMGGRRSPCARPPRR